jgi:hypothetical protein
LKLCAYFPLSSKYIITYTTPININPNINVYHIGYSGYFKRVISTTQTNNIASIAFFSNLFILIIPYYPDYPYYPYYPDNPYNPDIIKGRVYKT